MTEDQIKARQRTTNYFKAYRQKYPCKTRIDAINAAWSYFKAFNDKPISDSARQWFKQNIGKPDIGF